jgi:hypothetical protein
MAGLNLTLLSEVSNHARASKYGGLIGADFNAPPEDVVATKALDGLDAVILAPAPTCTASKKLSTIDYFIIHGGMQSGIASAKVEICAAIRTHRPVHVVFEEKLVELRRRCLKKPPMIPIEKVFGPLPPARDTDELMKAATKAKEEALEAARDLDGRDLSESSQAKKALESLDSALRLFADHAEKELLDVTSSEISVTGMRGRKPKTIWAPLVAEKVVKDDFDKRVTSALQEARHLRDLAIDARQMVHSEPCGTTANSLIERLRQYEAVETWPNEGTDVPEVDRALQEIMPMLRRARVDCAHIVSMAVTETYVATIKPWSNLIRGVAEDAINATQVLEDATSALRKKEIHSKWRGSLREVKAGATKRAFLYAQIPEEAADQVVFDQEAGVHTADPVFWRVHDYIKF